jgi:glycosidase
MSRSIGLLLWALGVFAWAAPPCQNDTPGIIAEGLGHDSFAADYRHPFGAVTTDQGSVRIRFRTCRGNADRVTLHWRDNAAGTEGDLQMNPVGDGTDSWLGEVSFWEVGIPVPTHPTLLYYRFVATRGSQSLGYLNRDPALESGGWGVVSAQQRPGYGISVYEPDFRVANWLKGAVIYQIFPDRFRNGDPSNDPADGSGFIYGQAIRKLGWSQPLCDPRGSECPGEYSNQFYGGDLAGVTEELPYLASLGVSAIYLNPIFRAASNHGYDTQNYLQIEPRLGTLDDFVRLARSARQLGIRLILDGVFNHTSSDSPYFDYYDRWSPALEVASGQPGDNDGSGACESAESPYRAWYWLPDQGTPGQLRATHASLTCPRVPIAGVSPQTYEAYAGYGSMPRLNGQADAVQKYFFAQGTASVGPFWIAQGAAGFRLDVGGAVDPGTGQNPSRTYWRGMRRALQAIDPDAVLIGEEWGDASPWLLGEQWDSAMNYRLRSALLNWMFDGCTGHGCSGGNFQDTNSNAFSVDGPIHAIGETDFDNRLRSIQESYPEPAWQAMMNLLGSHDTNRILFLLTKISNEDSAVAGQKLRMLLTFLFTYPGAATVYYGDEVGLATSGEWDGRQWQADPYCRGAYPWTDLGLSSDSDLRDWVRKLGGWRQRFPALRSGSFRTVGTDDSRRLYAFRRDAAGQTIWAVFNRDSQPHDIVLPVDAGITKVIDLASGTTVPIQRAQLDISQMPGMTARVFATEGR